MNASTVADWIMVLKAAEKLKFSYVNWWDGRSLWYCEFPDTTGGRLHRDLIIDDEDINYKPDEDV